MSMRSTTLILGAALCIALAACEDSGNDDGAATPARLEPAACDFELPAGQDPTGVECGFAVVPEDRGRNDGRTVRIAYAMFKASGPNPVADPLVYLDGGPGGPTLRYLDFLVPLFAPFQPQRDLIFFDQRGIGRSQPALDCPEWREAFAAYLTVAQSLDEDAAALQAAMRACHDRLAAEGVNFAAYTSSASAHDVEDLLTALGYDEWNLYGISYGTRLGLTALAIRQGTCAASASTRSCRCKKT